MPTFEIAWNRRHLEWRSHPEAAPWLIESVLCERILLGGKPTMRVVNGRQSPWLAVLSQAQNTMLGFAHRLRLSPQGRSPTNPSRPSRPERPLSVYETMALEADDGSA
jgi:hypothetical protein